MAVVAMGMIPIVALAQAREGRARPDGGSTTRDQGQPPVAQEIPRDTAAHRAVRGTVRDASGKLIADASIFAVGQLEPQPQMVDGRLQYTDEREKVLTRASSDRDGKFTWISRSIPPS